MTTSHHSAEVQIEGMGAIVHNDGVYFRVWAPHAKTIFISGVFNKWKPSSKKYELIHEGNGYWGLDINDAKVGDEYKYIIHTHDGKKLERVDPYAKSVTNSIGNAIIYDSNAFDWEDEYFEMPSWNKLVIYEFHVGTFNAKDKGVPGDFLTAIDRIPYLKALGINAVEVMPPFEFAGDFSWGYNPAHPFAIESAYGGPDAFKQFIKVCHKHGIAVILDVVYNHFGPTDLSIWQFDGWHEDNKGGIYFYNDWKSVTPWGDSRPDYGRGEVRQYIRDNALTWLEEFRCDGLRFDMIPYIRNVHADENPDTNIYEGWELLRWINKEIHQKFPWKITIAEDLHGLNAVTENLENGGVGFGSQWDANFVHPVRETIIKIEDDHRDMEVIKNSLLHRYNDDAYRRVVFTESHDEVSNGKARVAEEIADDDVNNYFSKKRSSLGMALTLTSPGIPMIFQGQELLEDKWFSDTDPIDWSRFSEFKGFAKMFRDMIKLRLNFFNNTEGLSGQHTDILHINNEEKIIAYHRFLNWGKGDSVVVVLNFRDRGHDSYSIPFPAEGTWKIRFNSDWGGYDEDFNDQFVYDTIAENSEGNVFANVSIAAYSAIILSQDREV